jgi:hypothetical protein
MRLEYRVVLARLQIGMKVRARTAEAFDATNVAGKSRDFSPGCKTSAGWRLVLIIKLKTTWVLFISVVSLFCFVPIYETASNEFFEHKFEM